MSASLVHKVVRKLVKEQADDELVMHAVMAFRLGGAKEDVAAGLRAAGGLAGLAIASAAKGFKGPDPHQPGSLLPLPPRCIVALTDRRLLIFAGSSWSNGPRQLVRDTPISQITLVGEPVFDGHVTKTERVIVGLANGMLLGWEFPRLSMRSGRALMADLAQQVSGGPASTRT